MKNKIQKYLSGEREGFSLVELIIVIAIMAILIGIIALAVIPYLEKSRVGKDRQTVDTVYSAFQSAIADCQVTDTTIIKIPKSGPVDATTGTKAGDVKSAMEKTLDTADLTTIAAKLESKKASTNGIECKYDKDSGTIYVKSLGDTTIESKNKDVPKKTE